MDSSLVFVLNGNGITVILSYLLEEDIKKGRLIPLLAGYEADDVSIFAVYPDPHYLPAKVRLFIKI